MLINKLISLNDERKFTPEIESKIFFLNSEIKNKTNLQPWILNKNII